MTAPHFSILLNEILSFYEGVPLAAFVDATLGAGGHAEAILQAHPEMHMFVGIDQDPIARKIARERLSHWKEKVEIFEGNFSKLPYYLQQLKIEKVQGILFDLGASSMQFDQPEKGFSFMHDGLLDMRMDPSNPLSAEEIVNTWSEDSLGRIFRTFGEEKRWRVAARSITEARNKRRIRTTFDLVEILKNALPSYNKKRIHPATLIFQALRICVNDELTAIEKTLPLAIDCLEKGGILCAISFHSLEDRIVKNIFRHAASDKMNTSGISGLFLDKEPQVEILTKKPMTPSSKELAQNPRSRSAKLRAVKKL